MAKKVILTLQDDEYFYFSKAAEKLQIPLGDVLKKLLNDGFILMEDEEAYDQVVEALNGCTQEVRDLGIDIVEHMEEPMKSASMEKMTAILEELRELKKGVFLLYKHRLEEKAAWDKKLLLVYNLREDMALLRNRIKQVMQEAISSFPNP